MRASLLSIGAAISIVLVCACDGGFSQDAVVTYKTYYTTCNNAHAHNEPNIRESEKETECLVARTGAESLDRYVTNRDSAIRVAVWNTNGVPVVLFDLVKRNNNEVLVSIYNPLISKTGFSEHVSDKTWTGVLATMDSLTEDGRPLHGGNPIARSESVCFDEWIAHVEATVAGRNKSEVDLDGCERDYYLFVDGITKAIVSALPPCARLGQPYSDVAARQIGDCALLAGDRMLDADALNAANLLTKTSFQKQRRDATDFEMIMSNDVKLRMYRAQTVFGKHESALAWYSMLDILPYFSLEPTAISGSDARVEIHGTASCSTRDAQQENQEFRAPYKQIWTTNGKGKMLLSYMEIGEFMKDEY